MSPPDQVRRARPDGSLVSGPVPGAQRCRILLVEDSDIDAELIGIHLARAGLDYELRRARSRAEFIRLVALDGVDLVLSDYSLPDIDGLKALELARERLPDVPFVFISGVGGEEPATDALRRGATDYVLKRNLARLPTSIARALSEAQERSRRREAESALVKSEANMRLALDAATLGLWQFFDDGTIGWDEACGAMLGVDDDLGRSEHAPYQRLLERVHADDRVDFDRTVQAALAADSAAGLAHECRFVTADGEVRWILLRGRRLGAAGDGGVRMTGVMQDLTSTRSLESRQRRAEVLFRIAAQATGLGLWEIGPEPDRIWVDESYCRLAGIERSGGEDLRPLIAAVVHPDDRAALHAAIDAAYDGRTDEIEVEHRLIRPTATDGIGWLAVRGRRIVGADGANRLVGTVRDITEARRQQRALVASNEELERRVAERTRELTSEIAERSRVEDTLLHMQRLEAVGQLTSGVAHDFNNLLTVVLSNVTLVGKLLAQQPVTDERIAKRLESMRDAAQRGATLTRQLLAFSRRQRLAPQAVNFNEIVRGMRDLLHTTLGGSVNLVTELADDVWTALVDPTQMELIILNLAINARDAMEVGGSLMVRTANATLDSAPARPEEPEPGDYVVVGVSDTGTGMSDAVLAKAFEPFFTTKDVGKGSGLGLAQVFGFAKQSGGGVRIETELGRGTTVSVYMPRARDAVVGGGAERPARVEPPPATSAAGRCVLVVDDDLAVREATAAVLATHGYRVEEAGEAASAIDRLREPERIDLALVDFAMPLMNGAELAIIARQLRPGLPIVFLTGYADLRLLEAGQERFVLQKPIEESELVARIGEALQAAEAARD